MKLQGVDNSMLSEFPNTLRWLKELEPTLLNEGCEIIIRDTDHHFDSIRIEVKPLNGDYETACKYSNQINDYVSSHCCRCGSSRGIRVIGESSISSTVCQDCAEVLQIKGVQVEGPELDLIPALKQGRIVPNIKCRLKAADGHIFYKYSGDITWQDGTFLIKEREKVEPVILGGVYTGLRDFNGERIYTGDIVLAEDLDGQKFWGMIMYGNKWGKSERDISPQWNRFCLVHGFDSFPSALCWAKKIEVIGNVVTNRGFQGPVPSAIDYEEYYLNHKINTPKFSDEK